MRVFPIVSDNLIYCDRGGNVNVCWESVCFGSAPSSYRLSYLEKK